MPLVEIQGLHKSFGGHQVLTNVDAHVDRGEIVGLIGPNGAGKSTLFNCIMGIYQPTTGSVRLSGRSLLGIPSHRVCHLGIARTFQEVKVFPSLTAKQNVKVGEEYGRSRQKGGKARTAQECLEFVGLGEVADVPTIRLNFMERRLVEVGRALATDPQLLLLDEPMAGLNPSESKSMLEIIRGIRTEGTSVFWVEHKLDAVFELCDRITVLDFGTKIADGTPGEIAANKVVIDAYLGTGEASC